MKKQNRDIIFLQETHITESTIHNFNNLWPGKCYHSCYTNRSRGVCIMVRRNVQYELIDVKRCDNGQFVIMVCKIGTRAYLLANFYGPNDDDSTFYRNFVGTISSFDTDYASIGGDFNFVINPTLDSMNYARQYNINANNAFINFASEKELI